jgi:hypothetical protein
MKLNRKKLNIVLPQIKAYLNVAVMRDNHEHPGTVDFLFQPKSRETEMGYLNRLSVDMGNGNDLFGNAEVETLGKPVFINIARFRDALKGGGSYLKLENGTVNGINILASGNDHETAGVKKIINAGWKKLKDFGPPESVKFMMPRVDYNLLAGLMNRFVSKDSTRYSMQGYNIDFGKSDDFINFVATDGSRLAMCKFPCIHSTPWNEEGRRKDFIFKPLGLFIPGSNYSSVYWTVNEFVSLIRIRTEDYGIDCWSKSIEGVFPAYSRVIPSQEMNREWMSVSARSARTAFESIKGLINNSGYSTVKNQVCFNAEDPKRIRLMVPGALVDIDGEASRPMRLQVCWDYIESCFFDTPVTKFMIQDANKALFVEEARAVRGTTMTVTKVLMPMTSEDFADKWGIVDVNKLKAGGKVIQEVENGSDSFDEDEDEENEEDISFGNESEETDEEEYDGEEFGEDQNNG